MWKLEIDLRKKFFQGKKLVFKKFEFKNKPLDEIKYNSVNRYRRGLETCPQAKTSKSGHAIFFSFFPTRPSDEYDSAPSRKYSRPLLDGFAWIG